MRTKDTYRRMLSLFLEMLDDLIIVNDFVVAVNNDAAHAIYVKTDGLDGKTGALILFGDYEVDSDGESSFIVESLIFVYGYYIVYLSTLDFMNPPEDDNEAEVRHYVLSIVEFMLQLLRFEKQKRIYLADDWYNNE